MYTYNKDDKSYTFSSDNFDIEKLVELEDIDNNEEKEQKDQTQIKKPTKIEVINGGNDLDISPVSDYLEIEKPKIEKKKNIIIPENKKD